MRKNTKSQLYKFVGCILRHDTLAFEHSRILATSRVEPKLSWLVLEVKQRAYWLLCNVKT